MNKLIDWGTGNKTQLVGAVAIITGIVTIITSGGETALMNAGWTQILGGFYAIFMRQGVKKVEDKVETKSEEVKEEVKAAAVPTPAVQGFLSPPPPAPMAALPSWGPVVELWISPAEIEELRDKGTTTLSISGAKITRKEL